MAKEISYGSYSFPHPYPFISLSHEPIIISGVVDHSIINASLIGEFTGCNFTNLKQQKDNLVLALSTGFQTLTVGESIYDYAQPTSVSFSSSNIRNRLPYSIEFTIQNETDFSVFYGIRDPVDTWSFNEEETSTVSATHTVSAYGNKITGDSLVNARNFVNSRLTGFDNAMSVMLSGRSPILVSKNEEINRVENFYSITENWKYSISQNDFDQSDSIVRASSSINYQQDGSLSISVNGTIEGGISGSADTGYFTKEDAVLVAKNALASSKSNVENQLYGLLFQEPVSSSYDIDTGANKISFSYEFSNPTETRQEEVLNDYSCSISANKDSSQISASVNGNIYYNKLSNANTGGLPELEYRFSLINSYLDTINPFAYVLESYNEFVSNVDEYSTLPLSNSLRSLSINKDPLNCKIDYSYSYSNNVDYFNGYLLNSNISINTNQEFLKYAVNQTVDNSFAVQNLYTSNKQISISVDGEFASGVNYNDVVNIVSGYMHSFASPDGFLINDSIDSGAGTLSMSKTFFFK